MIVTLAEYNTCNYHKMGSFGLPNFRLDKFVLLCNEQSNHTPRCSWKVSAAGLPWLDHFRVQCYYTWVKLVGSRRKKLHCYLATRPQFCAANLAEGGRLRVQSFVAF